MSFEDSKRKTPCGIWYHSCKEEYDPRDSLCNHNLLYHGCYCKGNLFKGECWTKKALASI